jgi:hypothetical protein
MFGMERVYHRIFDFQSLMRKFVLVCFHFRIVLAGPSASLRGDGKAEAFKTSAQTIKKVVMPL